jgi:predicted glycoside hydrolase/deacetylase ChbG (UPF0249 family)
MRRLIINADDYAMDEGVDRAILALIGRNVVTAASAMVLSPRWREAAGEIKDLDADCGLHLDLTSPFAVSRLKVPKLSDLITRTYTRRLRLGDTRDVIEAQLDLFEQALDRPPDFVDGHQHVHQLPHIRRLLTDALQIRYGAGAARIGIRICLSRRWRGTKAHTIGRLGARPMAELARQLGHPANTDFLGVYDLSPTADLPRLWRDWLATMQGNMPLAMCHVANASGWSEPNDLIRPARIKEYGWLSSDGFRDLCAANDVVLVRWPRGGGQ